MAVDHSPSRPLGARLALRMLALTLSVFGASVFAPMRLVSPARAQSLSPAAVEVTGLALQMQPQVRVEVASALSAMPDAQLGLTYARIHATFREFLGHDDLSVARALIDYAALAETELTRRGLPLPQGVEPSAGMYLAYELVL